MVKLEVGKYYKTRDGRKVGPLLVWADCEYRWSDHPNSGLNIWDDAGRSGLEECPTDIVSEWYTTCVAAQVDVQRDEYGPIRTRREIVPGTYGVVTVEKDDDGIFAHVECASTADELREASHTLAQLAEALDDNRA